MNTRTKSRFGIAALVYLMANAVLFGIGLLLVVTVPALTERAELLIPIVVVASFVFAAPIAWFLAPYLRARYGRNRMEELGGDDLALRRHG